MQNSSFPRCGRPKTAESEFLLKQMDVSNPHFFEGGAIRVPPLKNNTAKTSLVLCRCYTEELEQSRDEQQTIKHRADELDRTCRNLQAETETIKSTVESMERALEQKEVKIERSLKDMVSLKEDMDRRLFDKDEELQNMRYAEDRHRAVSPRYW